MTTQPTTDSVPAGGVDELLVRCHRFIEPRAEEGGYGFARPDNPHDFTPDSDCTAEEHAAHKAACEAYDRGEYQRDDWDGWNEDRTIHVTLAPWGIGCYTFRDPEATALLTDLEAARATVSALLANKARLTEENASLRADAERYRFVRECTEGWIGSFFSFDGTYAWRLHCDVSRDEWDKRIDSARAALHPTAPSEVTK